MSATRKRGRLDSRELSDLWRTFSRRAGRHSLLLYSSAIAFRALVSLIPLTLLGLGLLGAFRLKSVWRDSLAPPIKHRVTPPVYDAINFSVEKILHDGSTGLIALASVLALWNLAVGMRTIMQALNTIHETEETRSSLHRAALSLALAVVVAVCLIASVLVVTVAPRIAGGGLGVLVGIGRWLVAAALLGAAVGMLLRYAPAERPEVGWESVGSVLVIVSWVVASLLFRVWATSVADFKTAVGSLTVFLVLTAYIFTSSAIFLVGVELDEVLRQESGGKPRGFAQLVRELLAPGPAANG